MKSKQTIEKQLFEISEEDKKNLQLAIEELTTIIDKKNIKESTINKLTEVLTTVNSLRENYMWRLLRAAKQNHMID